jgi:hypothetical protein
MASSFHCAAPARNNSRGIPSTLTEYSFVLAARMLDHGELLSRSSGATGVQAPSIFNAFGSGSSSPTMHAVAPAEK